MQPTFEAKTPDGSLGGSYGRIEDAKQYFWAMIRQHILGECMDVYGGDELRFIQIGNTYHVIYHLPDNMTLTLGWIIVRP